VLAFEPFDGGSHRAVRESISRHSRHTWTWFTSPPRGWKWRMRLGAADLVEQARAAGALERRVDVIFATSLLSLADLIAELPPRLRATPAVLYMHENQAAYPSGHETEVSAERDTHFALTNLTSIRAADMTLWNSEWNRRSFEAGIAALLSHAPDARLRSLLPPAGEGRGAGGRVLWPPVEAPPRPAGPAVTPSRVLHKPVRVVWPHRWEHDKGPEELLRIATAAREGREDAGDAVVARGIRWTILGERYRKTPAALLEFERRFRDDIDHIGFEPDRGEYWRHLRRCDWVLSTAGHEYFGIAVVEALLSGCLPWLPDRLSYPELLPGCARGLSPARPPEDPTAIRAAVAAHLAPAVAPNAVGRLDVVISELAAAR